MSEWFRDEQFWVDTYPFMFTRERMDSAEEEIDNLLALSGFQGKTVLDLCCGPGRHSLALARAGFTVTGVDGSPFLLGKARSMAETAGLEIEWIHQDMRDFQRPEAFDLALNFFTSFGYFDDPEDDQKVLANLFACLKPGGLCIMELMSKENLAMVYQPTTSEHRPEAGTLVQRHEVFDDWNRVRNEWIVIRDGKAKSYWFDLRLYSGQELRECLKRTGFVDVKLYGDHEGHDFN
ncbi:MAG: methyltransferase domain-containing protein, partial [Planctomycetes bacterium]|nr:methyltransferase domain-containing protein [Planctomycetota bacterium]